MNGIIEAEYKIVQERTLPVIASEILQIEENVGRVALDGAIRIGERLKEAKEKVEHGKWEIWCSENLNYSKSKAEKLMKIATEYGNELTAYSKTYTCTDLSISKALKLLQVPESEVENFAKENKIDELTVKELEEKIRQLNEEKKQALDSASIEAEKAQSEKEAADKAIAELTDMSNELKEEIKELQRQLEESEEKQESADENVLAEKEEELKRLNNLLEEEKLQRSEDAKLAADRMRQAIEVEKEKLQLELEKSEAASREKLREEQEKYSKEIENLKKKADTSASENLITFKVKVDQLQAIAADCRTCIEKETGEQRAKMSIALSTVINHIIEEVGR